MNSISPSTSENAECAGGLTQSSPARHAANGRYFRCHLDGWEQSPETGLRALGELDLDRAHRRLGHALAQALQAEAPVRVAAAEVARADLERQLPAVTVRFRKASLAGVLQAARELRAAIQRLYSDGRERAVAHTGQVHDRCRAESVTSPVCRAEDLGGGNAVVRWPAWLPGRRRWCGERRVLDDQQALDGLHLVVGPEPEHVRLALRGGVHPAALIARERPLLVVGRDDVLAQLRAERLQRVAEVPDDREVTQDRAAALQQVVTDNARERGGDARSRAVEHGHSR